MEMVCSALSHHILLFSLFSLYFHSRQVFFFERGPLLRVLQELFQTHYLKSLEGGILTLKIAVASLGTVTIGTRFASSGKE